MKDFPIIKQEDYVQQLGTGEGYTIAKYGCALSCVTAIANWYGRIVTADQMNIQLVNAGGFASNGTKNQDGTVNKTLVIWGMVAAVYGEIKLDHNIAYPTTPADTQMIDSYLLHNQPVIVGVSFLHKASDKLPTHYVVIYAKNTDGSYMCMDPWYGDRASFDTRYAVNGMSVGNAILQVVAYTGPVAVDQPTDAPMASHEQLAVSPTDVYQKQAENNWNLYLQEVDLNKQQSDRIQTLETQVQSLSLTNGKLISEIGDTKALNATLSASLSKVEATDSVAVAEGITAQNKLKEQQRIVNTVSQTLQAKPTLKGILTELDTLFSKINWAKKVTQATQAPLAAQQAQQIPTITTYPTVLQLLGIQS